MNTFSMHDEVISKYSNYFQSFVNFKDLNFEQMINTSLIIKGFYCRMHCMPNYIGWITRKRHYGCLKEKDILKYVKYRQRRLVLEAWLSIEVSK